MEKNIAILMADLSGYTALTETHGPATAADLIDKYMQIAEDCLVGDSRIHERTGDELMIVSASPDSLLATALKLEASTRQEENFLQVHGGLHVGKLLMRSRSFFGSAINLVARIAAKSAAGTFSCSRDFMQSIADKSACTFVPRGIHRFKNISEEQEIFEISAAGTRAGKIDPVCRMLVNSPRYTLQQPGDEHTVFCSSYCRELYLNMHTVPLAI